MIPNRVAFFWHNKTMSWMRYWTLKSFRLHNPSVEMLIFTSKNICKTNNYSDSNNGEYNLREVASEVQATIVEWELPMKGNVYPHHASDFMQWEFLSTVGGWYSDMDILFMRPLPQPDADTVFCFSDSGNVFAIGFLASSGNNLIYKEVRTAAFLNHQLNSHENTGALAAYSSAGISAGFPHPAQRTLYYFQRKYPKIKIAIIPERQMYAYRCETVFTEVDPLVKDMIGLHWYGGHPISQKWNELLNERNWNSYESTFINAMRETRKL
jgi:hypothetical protein